MKAMVVKCAVQISIYAFFLAVISVCFLSIFDKITNVSAGKSDSVPRPENFIVWGVGFKKEVVLPARYFYVQIVDYYGNNVTNSIGENPFQIEVTSQSGTRARVWVRTTDRHDGSYVVQYKLYNSFPDLKITILYENKHISGSPYMLQGPVYHEKCYCPEPSMETWHRNMDCPSQGYSQIEQDLSIFPKINMEITAKAIIHRFNSARSHSLCHYVVKDNKVYRKTYGEHVGFKMFMDAVLLSMTRKVRLPDIEFFVNLGDWPLEKRKLNEGPLPIFSWCGSDDTWDIVMPTYDVTESTLETMGRVSLDLVSVQGAKTPKWENKTSLAFWRGRDSRQERLDLVRMSNKHSDIVDAKLTNMFFFKKADDLPMVKHISFFDFFKHKYQINLDGTVAAYRMPYLLAGDSLVLKQDSPYYEYFYNSLKPYEHYIPFKRDLSDLLEKIQWAKDNDEEVRQIALNARTYVRENLMADDIFCYHAVLFEELSKRLVKPPVVREDMELVEQPSDRDSQCECDRLNEQNKDEL